MKKLRYSTAVIGAGPAGLAAATGLLKAGISDFILLERDRNTGGILNQCIHNGFGLEFYGEDLTGPEFARRMEAGLKSTGLSDGHQPAVMCSAMVTGITGLTDGSGFSIQVHSREEGIFIIEAKSIITTTGCRERTRENIEIPGSRPAGIFTAGQAQNLINLRHYRIGREVVIQGSGDIGLIMARRLTLEGYKVTAVFERLPYLSGSIRNKVQCLDHFGIPLYLSRCISSINGRSRVKAVETSAVDQKLRFINDTTEIYECDTVLFAAGLIPELETVITGGVSLPDKFHPDINGLFETNIPGIFAAGNCLHINDLADTAAVEGLKAAEAAAAQLKSPQLFREQAKAEADEKPYAQPLPKTWLNSDFFKRLEDENLTVCIVCPKGCLLSEGNYGCSRGMEYYNRISGKTGGFMQRIHTTVELAGEIIPAVSLEEVPVSQARAVIVKLKKDAAEAEVFNQSIKVDHSGRSVHFNLCRKEAED